MDLLVELIVALVKALAKKGDRAPDEATAAQPIAPPTAPRAPDPELARKLERVELRARDEARRCAGEEANERFVPTLDGYVVARAARARKRLGEGGNPVEAARLLGHLEGLLEVMGDLAKQRRDPEKLLLLGDADALADACYKPVVDFARTHGIRLSSERTATMLIPREGCRHTLGPENLSILVGFNPTGLAPVLLPASWPVEPGWWPALAHEIGHDFHASVPGLDEEVRRIVGLKKDGWLPDGTFGLSARDVDGAFATWLPEIFADAFGTLMLGPAFLLTMMWSLGDPEHPENVLAIQPAPSWLTFAPHPPRHLRVVAGCRLLAEIGFPGDADRLERAWRDRHGDPDRFYFPTRRGSWLAVDETPLIERAGEITHSIYLDEMEALAGFELRSIPGLDLGPREHQAALDARTAYFSGRRATTRDPRCLIAGAVLAWHDRPHMAAQILRAARATIPSVGVAPRALRKRAASEDVGAAAVAAPGGISRDDWRDAIVLGEILDRPRALQSKP